MQVFDMSTNVSCQVHAALTHAKMMASVRWLQTPDEEMFLMVMFANASLDLRASTAK